MNTIAAMVLDFDGLLVESNGVKDVAFREIFSGYPDIGHAAWTFHVENVSLSRYDKFLYTATDLLGLPPGPERDDTVEALADRFRSLVADQVVVAPEVPGASAFLETWKGRLPIWIASMTPQEELESIVARRGMSDRFDAVFGCPPHAKSNVLLRCADEYGISPERVVMIGDAPGDLRAAEKAGTQFIGRRSEIPFPDDVTLYPDMYGVSDRLKSLVDQELRP